MSSPLSSVVYGGTDAATMQNALQLNSGSVASSSSASGGDRFWASNEALGSSPNQEVLEIDFASAGITNQITFDGVRYPHTITLEYAPSTGGDWTPVLDSVTKKPIVVQNWDSYPPVLADPSTIVGHFHPQHDYEGHWNTYTVNCAVAQIQKLRFILQRTNGAGPINVSGKAVPYSLAIQNVDTGYLIDSEDDIPFSLPEEESNTSNQVFASSSDVFGSSLGFSKKTHLASNLIYNTDIDAPLIWKSEPQPNSQAVVNFYADLRDSEGNPQIIDQIFIDPLYLGCSINLYYSNDVTTGDFLSARDGLDGTKVVLHGASVRNDGSLNLGTWHADAEGVDINGDPIDIPPHFDPFYVQLDNFYLGFDPSIPWTIGFEWTRDWNVDTDGLDHDLFSCDSFRIGQNQNDFYLVTVEGDVLTIPNDTVDNVPIQVLAIYNGTDLSFWVQQSGVTSSVTDVTVSVAIPSTLPSQLLIGTDLEQSAFSGGQISSFLISQAAAQDEGFLTDPSAYSSVPLMPADETVSKNNALLRFDTTQLSLTNTTGFIGGPAFPYESMNWTSIPRDYQMQRGIMKVPVTLAKFWNLEISNLRPENNEKFVPVTRQVKFFPASLFPANNPTVATTRQSSEDLALNVQQSLSSVNSYTDVPQYRGTGTNPSGVSNTEVFIAQDTAAAQRLAATGNPWRYQQLHPDTRSPRFNLVGPHVYQVETITQNSNMSFFAGLRNIVFSKTIRSAPQNLPVMEESFLDSDGIGGGLWQVTPTGLYSGPTAGTSYAQSYSIVLPTQTAVRGLQFAAHQSDAQALDIGGNFASTDYDPTQVATWTPYGDGKVFGLDFNAAIGESALLISRQANVGFWADIPVTYGPTYADIEADLLTYGDFKSGTNTSSFEGGVQSQSITAPYGGLLYGAAQITASENLTAPLYLQIIDTDTESVLAEAQSNVSMNKIDQWYAEIDLSTFGAILAETWGDLSGNEIWPSFSDTFTRANNSILGRMDSGQTWTTPTSYSSLVVTTDAAVVSGLPGRSEINTGTPWGTLTVNLDNVPTGGSIPLLDLGGLILTNSRTFYDTNESVAVATLGEAISTAHDYNFKFMLTSQVPSGQMVSGVDATIQPYSIVITTGTIGSDTWLQTISTAREFTPVRALMGQTATTWSKFKWTPSREQVKLGNFIPSQFQVSGVTPVDNTQFQYVNNGQTYTFDGLYTYTTLNLATQAASLCPVSNFMSPPAGASIQVFTTGGTFTAGTYYYKVTGVNAFGETTFGLEVDGFVIAGGSVQVSWVANVGASAFNVYRGTASGGESLIATVGAGVGNYLDTGAATDPTITVPKYNSTDGAGTMQVTDVIDQYGTFMFNVTQMPSNMTAADVTLAYLDYGDEVVTLQGNGSIVNQSTGTTLSTIAGFNPLSGPISVHYVNTALLSPAFLTAHPQGGNPTAVLIFQNNITYLGSWSGIGPTTWSSTVRGIGGANNGISSGQYTIIEGFSWSIDGAGIAPDSTAVTWAQVSYNDTRTYGQMSLSTPGTTQNIALRVVQKQPTNDSWFIQSAFFFWNPVVWEFSCDSGQTWWESSDIRNNPNGVLIFPQGLGSYNGVMWRVTSFAGRVSISHLAIRPWYSGQHGYTVPTPSNLPQGPNVVPGDDYGPIELDPRWMAWSNPVPHWWWNQGLTLTA